jgi:hypothetical protein
MGITKDYFPVMMMFGKFLIKMSIAIYSAVTSKHAAEKFKFQCTSRTGQTVLSSASEYYNRVYLGKLTDTLFHRVFTALAAWLVLGNVPLSRLCMCSMVGSCSLHGRYCNMRHFIFTEQCRNCHYQLEFSPP